MCIFLKLGIIYNFRFAVCGNTSAFTLKKIYFVDYLRHFAFEGLHLRY